MTPCGMEPNTIEKLKWNRSTWWRKSSQSSVTKRSDYVNVSLLSKLWIVQYVFTYFIRQCVIIISCIPLYVTRGLTCPRLFSALSDREAFMRSLYVVLLRHDWASLGALSRPNKHRNGEPAQLLYTVSECKQYFTKLLTKLRLTTMKLFKYLLKNVSPKIEYYSRFSPSPMSIKQFLDFGKYTLLLNFLNL